MPIVWIFLQMMASAAGRAYVPRVNHGGNFCGHIPDSPQLDLMKPTTSKRRPQILKLLQERLKRYYQSPNVLPSLNAANRSRRQQRSERREACLQLLTAILEFTELASLRCGVPTREGFLSLTLDYLVQYTGLGQRRAERALADLKAANLLTVSQPRQLQPDGSWRGLAAVKAVNKLLFACFGLGRRLRHERERASGRLREKALKNQAVQTATGWARSALVAGRMLRIRPRQSQQSPKPQQGSGQSPPVPIEYHRMRLDLLIALKETYPSMTAAEINREADRLLEGQTG